MIAFIRLDGNGTPLYQVAGSPASERNAEKALRLAHETHGGDCFYCKKRIAKGQVTIDHVDARAFSGTKDLQNLVIACKPCNALKGRQPIELFKPEAGREWLGALLAQVQDRLNRL
jgi:5-methylcytosine-specific restriction endonuclease McrA